MHTIYYSMYDNVPAKLIVNTYICMVLASSTHAAHNLTVKHTVHKKQDTPYKGSCMPHKLACHLHVTSILEMYCTFSYVKAVLLGPHGTQPTSPCQCVAASLARTAPTGFLELQHCCTSRSASSLAACV